MTLLIISLWLGTAWGAPPAMHDLAVCSDRFVAYSTHGTGKNLHVFDLKQPERSRSFESATSAQWSLYFSPDCTTLVADSANQGPLLVSTEGARIEDKPLNIPLRGAVALNFISPSELLALKRASDGSYAVETWNPQTTERVGYLVTGADALSVYPHRDVSSAEWVLTYRTPEGCQRLQFAQGQIVTAQTHPAFCPEKVALGKILKNEVLALSNKAHWFNGLREDALSLFALKTGERISTHNEGIGYQIHDRFSVAYVKEGIRERVLNAFDLASGQGSRLLPQGAGRVGAFAASAQGVAAMVRYSGQDWAIVFTDYKRQTRILASERFHTYPVELVRIRSTNDFVYPAYRFAANPEVPPRGSIVYVHGGGCHVTAFGFNLSHAPIEFERLNAEGYEVLAISYRNDSFLTPPHEGTERGPANCGTDELDDIVAAGRWLRERNPERPVFVWGESHGSYLVNWLITSRPDDFPWAGAISGSGFWSFEGDDYPTFAYPHDLFAQVQPYNRMREPLRALANKRAPLLAYHAVDDQSVPFRHLRKLMSASGVKFDKPLGPELQIREAPERAITFVISPSGGHGYIRGENYEAWVFELRRFLETNSRAGSRDQRATP